MLVMVRDDASHPAINTNSLSMAAASHRYCGAGGSWVHVALSMLYVCTICAKAILLQLPPQTYMFFPITIAVAPTVAMGRPVSLLECRAGGSSSS